MDRVNFLNLEYIFLRIVDFFKYFDIIAILNWIIYYVDLIKPLAIIISIFLVFVIFYARFKLKKMNREEEAKFQEEKAKATAIGSSAGPGADPALAVKWKQIMVLINSNNPSDWRLAILEADIMLGDVLDKMGFQGDSIGDKLKSVDKSDFLTLQKAWDAHTVRNRIAHEGADFQIDEREAKRVIDLFHAVFSEFYHI